MRRCINPSARQWEATRREVFDRDGYRCQQCGKAGRLEAHHVLHLASGGSNDLDNLLTLCRGCHIAAHKPTLTSGQAEWESLVAGIK